MFYFFNVSDMLTQKAILWSFDKTQYHILAKLIFMRGELVWNHCSLIGGILLFVLYGTVQWSLQIRSHPEKWFRNLDSHISIKSSCISFHLPQPRTERRTPKGKLHKRREILTGCYRIRLGRSQICVGALRNLKSSQEKLTYRDWLSSLTEGLPRLKEKFRLSIALTPSIRPQPATKRLEVIVKFGVSRLLEVLRRIYWTILVIRYSYGPGDREEGGGFEFGQVHILLRYILWQLQFAVYSTMIHTH